MDYGQLAKSYHPLKYTSDFRNMLVAFHNDESLQSLSDSEARAKINQDVIKHYGGEEVLKYRLAKHYRNKKYVAAFEVNVNSSRADFLVINGHTKCFEIKSKIDTLNRLDKQAQDYSEVFEYNIVLADEVHLKKITSTIPEYYGIWHFKGTKKVELRKASISPNTNPISQLNLLTKKELNRFFNSDLKDVIIHSSSPDEINSTFKEVLKARYQNRWNFITDRWSEILPLDFQFFFSKNVEPEVIYGY